MLRRKKVLLAASAALVAAACTPQTNLPLIFTQAHTVGITVNAATTQQSAELTLGYRDLDVAVVPTSISDAQGQLHPLQSEIRQYGPAGCNKYTEALSVLGQFSVSASTTASTTTPQVGIGKFFATGDAAKVLADGFKVQIATSKVTPPAAPPAAAATAPVDDPALLNACFASK